MQNLQFVDTLLDFTYTSFYLSEDPVRYPTLHLINMTPQSPVVCDNCSSFITNFPIVLLYLINITHYATTNIFMFKLLNCFFLIYAINIVVKCFISILTVVFHSHLFIWMRAPVPSDMSKRNLSVIKCKQEPNVQSSIQQFVSFL